MTPTGSEPEGAWPTAPPVLSAGSSGPAPTDRDPDAWADDPALVAEAETIARAQAGDRVAMRALYDENVRIVYSFIVRRVGAGHADDLTAEVFTKAFERLDRFEWRGIPLRSWLLRIAYNEIVGRARRRSSSEVVTDEPDAGAVAGHEDAVVASLSADGDVLEALARLSPPQRAAIELRYLRGLSVGETALVLDVQEEAVRALTYRGLKALRAALAPVIAAPPADPPSPASSGSPGSAADGLGGTPILDEDHPGPGSPPRPGADPEQGR